MESKTKDPFFVIARSAIDTNICKITFSVIEFLPVSLRSSWVFVLSFFFFKLRAMMNRVARKRDHDAGKTKC